MSRIFFLDNSPAFQRWAMASTAEKVPSGTKEPSDWLLRRNFDHELATASPSFGGHEHEPNSASTLRLPHVNRPFTRSLNR